MFISLRAECNRLPPAPGLKQSQLQANDDAYLFVYFLHPPRTSKVRV